MQDPFFKIDKSPRSARSMIKRTFIVLSILAFLVVLALPKFETYEEYEVNECKYWIRQGSPPSSAPGNFIENRCYSSNPDCSIKEKQLYIDAIRKKCNEILSNSAL